MYGIFAAFKKFEYEIKEEVLRSKHIIKLWQKIRINWISIMQE
jgi:hypothetical protein